MSTRTEDLKTIFTAKNLTLATAESCTAGLLGGAITAVAGSSAYYMGGAVSYADAAKVALLGVQQRTLNAAGAVSDEVAREMADGVRLRLAVDVGISITGVAGPGGGTVEKPVGLTYIGLSDATRIVAHRYVWEGDRRANREKSVDEALRLLIEWAEAR